MTDSVFSQIHHCYLIKDAAEKALATHAMVASVRQREFDTADWLQAPSVHEPGRPDKPELVNPGSVSKRKLGSPEGRAVLMHAIAHIEFNAINLALDAAQRFPDMPRQFYLDWLQVADEEALHFTMIRRHLQSLGYDYGDFTAHSGLWEMAENTADDVMVRMALVPRVLEARGLDVTPGIQQRLAKVGDQQAVGMLDVIFRDEVGHVAIGSRWFKYCCDQRGLDAEPTFFALVDKYYTGNLHGPFNLDARVQAGFSDNEIALLTKDL
ncbi:MAG: hypothetical protein AUJ56_04880 [Zetaproteobacteria bacterium CG1_02_49_23]|nr:MAG: hypothetical protein AUJ56_04880 [Zetaproteobacteria bacterium CG1_02_49_23]